MLVPALAATLGLATLTAPAAQAEDQPQSWTVSQPLASGQALTATVALNASGELSLGVRRGSTTVLEPAPVGLVTSQADLSTGLRPTGRSDKLVEETYQATTGKRLKRSTSMNETRLSFTGAHDTPIDLVVRVSDDGVAYRYDLPTTTSGTVSQEKSAFQLPANATAWLTKYGVNHEEHHTETTAVNAATGSFGYPALFHVQDSYVLLSESGVNGSYAGSQLAHTSGSNRYTLKLSDDDVDINGPLTTPWRAAIVGDLASVTESTFTDDIAPASRISDTSWIKPGKVAWSWLAGGHSVQASLAAQQSFVDYSAQHGWEYSLVDDGWKGQTWMPDLVRYGAQRGVKIMAWIHWTDLDTEAERDTVLTQMNEWGVSGLKIDFMDSESQSRFQWYDEILKATAEHKLMVNFHGSTIPNGIQRTWPHVITLEAVRGAEYGGSHSLTDLTTNPFTRNVVGSMDYTPMDFQQGGHTNSEAAELALSVVYESGFQNLAGTLSAYRARPEVERFLEQVPTVWNDSKLVSGLPGQGATFARRSANRWFLGSISSGGAHTEQVPLGFLGGGEWLVETVRDGSDGLVRESHTVKRSDTLSVPVPANGGFVAIACHAKPGQTTCDKAVDGLPPASFTLTPDKVEIEPGATAEVKGRFTVDSQVPVTDVSITADAPAGWTITGTGTSADSLAEGEALTPTWTITAPADATVNTGTDVSLTATYSVERKGKDATLTKESKLRLFVPEPGVDYVSALPFAAESNGWGPVERDTSNGENSRGDGSPMQIAGDRYYKGLGTHASSSVSVQLDGRYTRFITQVGVDDEVGSNGAVAFEVVADGKVIATTPVLTGDDQALTIDVDVTSAQQLTLRVTDGGNGINHDHADWANARLVLAG
ncbi:glycoside hydrolase family 97 catalytic domain-containing protein [Wenjunlia vitaminophila]|uniref:glycoside hydrolase family 97 catalytic domain-containing protein n=1 Tax=Wenjunlia vitaminophila TaxID=76728 RepID=UPI0003613B67|nr:glycoside hydrolase family 97 catalytic domain-containing protein [Wenjunlia vitaminophila]